MLQMLLDWCAYTWKIMCELVCVSEVCVSGYAHSLENLHISEHNKTATWTPLLTFPASSIMPPLLFMCHFWWRCCLLGENITTAVQMQDCYVLNIALNPWAEADLPDLPKNLENDANACSYQTKMLISDFFFFYWNETFQMFIFFTYFIQTGRGGQGS